MSKASKQPGSARGREGTSPISELPLYLLLAAKGAIQLEALGMKHSRRSARKHWAMLLGLPPSSKHDVVIDALNVKIEERRNDHT